MTRFFFLFNLRHMFISHSPSRLHVTSTCIKSRIQKETISGTRKRGWMAERGGTTSCSFQTDVRRRCATGRTARVSTPRWNMRVMQPTHLQKKNDNRASEKNTTKVEPGCCVRVLTIRSCHYNSSLVKYVSTMWNPSATFQKHIFIPYLSEKHIVHHRIQINNSNICYINETIPSLEIPSVDFLTRNNQLLSAT